MGKPWDESSGKGELRPAGDLRNGAKGSVKAIQSVPSLIRYDLTVLIFAVFAPPVKIRTWQKA